VSIVRAIRRSGEDVLPFATARARCAALGLAGGLAALALLAAPACAAPEKTSLTIGIGGVSSQTYFLAVNIARYQGYFKAEGLDAEIIDFASGTKALQAMMGGSADVTAGAYEHTLTMHAKGLDIRSIILFGRYPGNVLGIAKSKLATFKDLRDLKGMTVGISAPGAATDIFLTLVLESVGLTHDDVSVVAIGNGTGAIAAMRKGGELGAISSLDPTITQLVTSGDIAPKVDSRTDAGTRAVYGGPYASGCFYVKAEFIDKYPNTAQALANALVRAFRFVAKATPEQIMAILPPEYFQGDKELYHQSLIHNLPNVSPDGMISKEASETVLKVMSKVQPEVRGAKIDLATTYTNRFAEQANKLIP
jgi:NitT/TauT family transport system substrate-binding protein